MKLLSQFIKSRKSSDELLVDFRRNKSTGINTSRNSGRDYSNYIFAPEYSNYNKNTDVSEPDSGMFVVADSLISVDGDYIPQPYKTRLTMDMVFGMPAIAAFLVPKG